jgi:hypothetical protein
MDLSQTSCITTFVTCEEAARRGSAILRTSRREKEFVLQDWFKQRLDEARIAHDEPSRNVYPDFRLVNFAEGYEVKGLEFPGREATFDANSQVPAGRHRGRTIYYVFGRYPPYSERTTEYPIIDLVVCHGDFLNADHEYVHENKSFKGFGTYGDLMVRDRKMYVIPTPFALVDGAAGHRTLILPEDAPVSSAVQSVGELVRTEVEEIIVAYAFDLRTRQLTTRTIANPMAGQEHRFRAYRASDAEGPQVKLARHSEGPERRLAFEYHDQQGCES